MSFYPDVNPGQNFEPSAQLENDVRRLVNRGGLSGVRASVGGVQIENICINAYNPLNVAIADGDVVSIPEGALSEGAFPVATLTEHELWQNNWGIAQGEIGPHQYGSVLVMGAAIVPIVSETGTDTFEYVVPVGNGGSFKKSKRGIARYIRPVGTGYALIFVGISSGSVYERGVGVQITGGTYGIAPVISAKINPGENITITGGTDGTPYTISATGGGGGSTFYVPQYSQLYVSGNLTSDDHGRATTFIIPVKSGTIYISDDGGGAVAAYTDITGTTHHEIDIGEGEDYEAPADGWLRVSVYDDGTHGGACLRVSSYTGTIPLYKYGGHASGNVGYPDYIALAGGTASNSLGTITDEDYSGGAVPGPSSMPSDPKLGITYFLPVSAGSPIKYYASVAALVRFAPVSGGYHFYYDLSNELEWTPNCDGWLRISLLDDGNHSSECFRIYIGGEQWSDAVPLYKGGKFGNQGATGITATVSGGTASSITLTGGTGSVIVEPGNENVTIDGSTNGRIRISATGGGGGGGYVPRWGTHFHYSPQDAADKNWMYYDEINNQTIVELYTLNPRHMTAGARGYLKGSSLSPDNSFTTAAEGYLFCFAELACDGSATASNPGSVHAVIGYGQFKVCSVYGSSVSVGGSLVIPVRANQRIELNMSNIDTSSSIIGMIFYENGKDYRYPDDSE